MSVAQGFTFPLICVLVSLLSLHQKCDALCFFPTELQGEFVMQSADSRGMGTSEIQYSHVNITMESIPIWGLCHRRIRNNYILMDSSSGDNCIRCFHLTLKSRNVLLVRTEALGKCYTTEAAAEANCPSAMTNHMTEFLLYKEKEVGGEEISKSFCPVHGKFTFVYNVDDGTEDKMECDTSISVMDSCSIPAPASSINLHFQGCSFRDVQNLTFHCLGDWEGPGNQRYAALLNPSEDKSKPRYRCALYHTDKNGKVYMAFSSDSTCTSNLHNSTSGYETIVLTPTKEQEYPPKVLMSQCRYPTWMQGAWEYMTVNGPIITYIDHLSYRMYHIRCIGSPDENSNLFPVFMRDQCGGEAYNCIWVEKRAPNVLEFELGLNPSPVYNESLCFETNFPYPKREWVTQARLDRLEESPCPITGEYTGRIPDNSGLCAKLSSDCKSKEIMYYTMSECMRKDVSEGRITRISRNKRDTETSSDDKIFHVTNPRSLPTTQSELVDSDNPSASTTPNPTEPVINTTEIVPALIDEDSPVESPKDNIQSPATVNTPFYSLEDMELERTKTNQPEATDKVISSVVTTEISSISSAETSLPRTTSSLETSWHVSQYENEQTPTSSSTTDRPTFTTDKGIIIIKSRGTNVTHNSSFDSSFKISNSRDQGFEVSNSRRDDYNINFNSRQNYGPTTRVTPVTFHGSISEIPFQRGFRYPNKFQRQQPPTLPTPPMYNYHRNWMDHSHGNGYSQFRVRQEPGRYVEQNPYPVTTGRTDVRRSWEMRLAESHPVFVSNNHRVLPNKPRTPVALPPIQLPPPNYSVTNNRRPQLTSSAATPPREERDYRCLGQWTEKGLMYTYTQRRDIGTYECFVGSIVSENEIYIQEAGDHCERNVNPLRMGMQLTHKGDCTDTQLNPIPWDTGVRQTTPPPYWGVMWHSTMEPTVMWHSTRQPHVTKPWKPITAPPRIRNEVLNGGHITSSASNFIIKLTLCVHLFVIFTSLS